MGPKGLDMSLFVSLSCVHHWINYVLDACGCVCACLLSASMVTASITALCLLMSDVVNYLCSSSVYNIHSPHTVGICVCVRLCIA